MSYMMNASTQHVTPLTPSRAYATNNDKNNFKNELLGVSHNFSKESRNKKSKFVPKFDRTEQSEDDATL